MAKDFSLPEGTHTVILGVGDMCGIMRGKRIPASHWEAICKDGNALSIALLAIDILSSYRVQVVDSHALMVIL